MRLSDVKIVERLVHDDPEYQIVITPMINAVEQIGPSSVDVHLGTQFMVVAHSDRLNFDPLMSPDEYSEWLKHLRLVNRYSVLEKFILHPFQFALGRTLEFISLPRDIVGRIDGRSSWARQGLVVHSTAGDIHPGTRGFVVFELMNYGPVPIVLYPGLAIAQLTFEAVEDVRESYAERATSKYYGFRPSLWSGYPNDSILQAMRQLRGPWGEEFLRPQRRAISDEGGNQPTEHRFLGSYTYQEKEHESAGTTLAEEMSSIQNRELVGQDFERAFKYYQEHRIELISRYAGQYIAILNDEVVDSDVDRKELSKRTYERFGNKPLFMSFVSTTLLRPKYLGGPRGFPK